MGAITFSLALSKMVAEMKSWKTSYNQQFERMRKTFAAYGLAPWRTAYYNRYPSGTKTASSSQPSLICQTASRVFIRDSATPPGTLCLTTQ
jgi:hypothetical protein